MKHFIFSNNKRKILFLYVILFFFSIKINAQTSGAATFKAPEFTPKSPEASAFLKYGDYPVDLSTGVPSISLPIYSIKVDDVEVPIALSYHASGIKVGQEATWVGLGWNLNAGAQIILSARDGIDENDAGIDTGDRDASFVKQFMQQHPYGFTSNYLTEFEKSKVKDVYSFSSPTVSGNFYINNGIPVIFPPDAFKVEFYGTPVITNFTITDKTGNKYVFKSTAEKSVRSLTHHDDYISAWYVDEIITSKNNKIKFTYQSDGDIVEYSESESIGIIEEGKNCGCFDGSKNQTVGQIRKSSENTTTSAKKIKEITFNDDQSKVEFELKKGRLDLINQNGYLESVKISQKAFDGFNVFKKVSFEYSYFNESETGVNAYKHKRLKLDRIYENNTSNSHRFVYSDINLPIKDSKSQDYYGYYNGANNSDLIPKHTITSPSIQIIGTSDRSVNSNTIQAGILTEIYYPTKGFSRFSYEPNTYYGVDQLNKYVIKNQGFSIYGEGPANITAPLRLEDPGGETDFVGSNCKSDGNCLKYKIFYRHLSNPQNSFITYSITNTNLDTNNFKYSYGRIIIINSNGSTVFDSQPKKSIASKTESIPSTAGDYMIILEVYGGNIGVGLDFNYVEEDNTPKNLVGSGLRLKSIESFNYDNTSLLKKTYDYRDLSNVNNFIDPPSSGRFINDLVADFTSGSFANFSIGSCPVLDGASANIPKVDYTKGYYISSRSKQGIESNTIVYKNVTETSVDQKDSRKFYTEYDFSTDSDWSRPDVGLQINYGWKRGKILEKRDYKIVGSSRYIVKKEQNDYFEDNSKVSYVKGYKLEKRSTIDVFENSNPLEQPAYLAILSDCQVPQGLSTSYVLADYNVPIPWYYQKSSVVSDYFYDSSNVLKGKVVNTSTFNYNNPSHLQLTSQETRNSKGETVESKYFYAQDSEMAGQPFIEELKTANMVGIPLKTQTFNGNQKLSEQLTVYGKSAATSNLLLPNSIYAKKGSSGISTSEDRKITYDLYDSKGNLLQYTLEGGNPVSIIWGYNRTQPIAKLENVLFNIIPAETISNLQTLSNEDNDNCMSAECGEQRLRNALNALRVSFPAAFVSSFTYNPFVGLTSTTDVKGISSYYEYDDLGRLRFVKDKDLNVLQKYCYNYKGQTIDCGDNSSGSVMQYKSIARSGSFTKNDCASGGSGSSVAYSQNAGSVSSAVSQADADSLGLAKFNTDGQNYANANGYCTFYSVAQSGSFTKNNCAAGGSGSSVAYSQNAGVMSSNLSQADADALGVARFNTDGQNYANANGYCTFYSAAQNGSFTKNDCAAGGSGSSVTYSQNAGVMSSNLSQADADALGLARFNTDGQNYANSHAQCTFYSMAQSGSFTKNDCAAGGSGSSVTYSQNAGVMSSNLSQADADALGLARFNIDGQNYANANGYCTFYSVAQSGSFTKNNCAAGGSGSIVSYSQNAGAESSTVSQADADALGLSKFNTDGQNYANANGYCTFYSAAQSGSFTKNNCAAGGSGSSVSYSQNAGVISSTVSQADADALGAAKFYLDGQNYANANSYCTFYSAAQSGSFTKNNCAAGGSGSSVTYNQNAGAVSSTISQDNADALGASKFYTDGQNYANANGYCTFYSSALSGSFTKNNCAAGGYGSSVAYSQNWGAASSVNSQAEAEALGAAKFNSEGQAYANANGYCTFYSSALSGSITKNNCAAGGYGSSVSYSQNWGAASSVNSQAEAEALGAAKFNSEGQAYANANGYCTFYSSALSGSFTKNDCAAGGYGSSVSYSQNWGAASSVNSQAEAEALGAAKFNNEGQAYANTNGYCTFYSSALSGAFIKNDCAAGGYGSSVSYSQNWGAASSINSQAEAEALGAAKFNNEGQAYANANGYCTFYSSALSGSFTKNNCAAGGYGSSVAYSQNWGVLSSTISQADADALGAAKFNNEGQAYANANGYCTFYSAAQSGSFTKNDCAAGGAGSSIVYNQASGAITSTVSQADADAQGFNKFIVDGQNYINSIGYCEFKNTLISRTFNKNNCPPEASPGAFTYSVPYGRYTSRISQADADQSALNDINNNGQNYANIEAGCTFYNTAKSGTFTKNNCGTGFTGGSVTYSVPQGKYTSMNSQADADNIAQADVTNNGQAYANVNGTCTQIPQQVSFTYEYMFSSVAKLLYLDIYSSTSNHAGATLYFSIKYVRVIGTQQDTQTATVFIQPNAEAKSLTISVNAKSIVSVDLVNVVRN